MDFSEKYLRTAGLVNSEKYKNKPYGHTNGATPAVKFQTHKSKCHGGEYIPSCLACQELMSKLQDFDNLTKPI